MKRWKHTKLQIAVEAAAALLLLATVIFFCCAYGKLPEKIPVHYALDGSVNAWGDKFTLVWTLLLDIGLYAVFTGISFYPSVWSMPHGVTEENRSLVFSLIFEMLLWVKLVLTGVLSLILTSALAPFSMKPGYLVAFFALLLIAVIWYEYRISKSIRHHNV